MQEVVSIPLWCDCKIAPLLSCSLTSIVSIPLWCDCKGGGAGGGSGIHAGFNPTMVRLQGAFPQALILHAMVSIPLWCDCKEKLINRVRKYTEVSIPLWCDCKSCCLISHRAAASFQSHYGAIASCEFDFDHGMVRGFNPTMVRLQDEKGR